MNVREAMEVFKQNSWNVENFEDPGDALLYGDSKTSNCDSKFMDYLETLKSDNEEDNKVVESIMTGYDAFMNDVIKTRVNMIKDWEHKYIQAVHEQEVEEKEDWEREYARFAHEQRVAAYNDRYPFMLTDNDEEEDVKKEPKEMTLLEKLSQRSDAGLLADKFTNFLKTNSLQK